MIKLRPTFILPRRYLVNKDGDRTAVPQDYRLPATLHKLGFRLQQAEENGTLRGDVMRLRDQLEEVARQDPAISVEAVLEALNEILGQDVRRQELAPDIRE